MESSRLFVKNLPPTITEADFRKHFTTGGRDVTDIKLIAKRRIGYVGYKTAADAAKAVKFFNKSYIRMSRISVEIARPIADPSLPNAHNAQRTASKLPTPEPEPRAQQDGADGTNKKRKRDDVDKSDPKLREYLDVMGQGQTSSSKLEGIMGQSADPIVDVPMVGIEEESDGEYETIPAPKSKRQKDDVAVAIPAGSAAAASAAEPAVINAPSPPVAEDTRAAVQAAEATDDDWLRSRTNRLLDLVDPDELDLTPNPVRPIPVIQQSKLSASDDVGMDMTSPDLEPAHDSAAEQAEDDSAAGQIRRTARLFVRNLPFKATEAELRDHFAKYGEVEEVHVAVASSGQGKGFAHVSFVDSASAVAAFEDADGKPFQGRLLHVLPGQPKKDNQLDEFAISQLPLKKQNLIRKKAQATNSTFNWNSLYMNQDAVIGSTADRLGVSKSELLDPTSTDAAVKQAIAETHIITETKAYFASHGANLDAFKSQKKGDVAILVKNIPFGTSLEELRKLFEEAAGGNVLQVLMPPSKTMAIVHFSQPVACRTAFAKLSYRRLGSSILFLEKAPENLLADQQAIALPQEDGPVSVHKVSATDLLGRAGDQDDADTTSLYVRNLNFDTTTAQLTEAFAGLDGFVKAQVKTKQDSKKPGQILSMGFGFVHFRSKAQAEAALKIIDGHILDGHTLGAKASHKGVDAAEERRRAEKAKKGAGQRTKIVVKNLAFEASKADLRKLLSTYGKLRVVRIPKRFGNTSRGFAFAEFESPYDAENCIKSLKDTHLLGRRLVLDYAEAEAVDAEEEIAKMQKKVGGQVHRVAIQKLTAGKSRQKFEVGEEKDDEA